jgi:hypothetical protein
VSEPLYPGGGDSEPRRPGLFSRLHGEWVEVFATVLLALATIASAWSAYQAARWSSQEALRFNEATALRVQGEEVDDLADTELDIDVEMFVDYLAVLRAGDAEGAAYFETTLFRDEMKTAVAAWKATDPLSNPEAPAVPFEMEEYRNSNREKSQELEREAQGKVEAARNAIHNSDFYILLTVLFASVLFFAGISTKFKAPGVRVAVLLIGTVFFLGSLVVLLTQPIL